MKKLGFYSIHENAFANRLKIKEYDGELPDEIVTETWYKLPGRTDIGHFPLPR